MGFVSDWVDKRIKLAIDEANADLLADVQKVVGDAENRVITELDGVSQAVLNLGQAVANSAANIVDRILAKFPHF